MSNEGFLTIKDKENIRNESADFRRSLINYYSIEEVEKCTEFVTGRQDYFFKCNPIALQVIALALNNGFPENFVKGKINKILDTRFVHKKAKQKEKVNNS